MKQNILDLVSQHWEVMPRSKELGPGLSSDCQRAILEFIELAGCLLVVPGRAILELSGCWLVMPGRAMLEFIDLADC